MLSKTRLQFIKALHRKKNRDQEKLFISEGDKVVNELIQSDFKIHSIYGLENWIESHASVLKNPSQRVFIISQGELDQISTLATPNKVFAVAHQKNNIIPTDELKNELILAVDSISDPGNFGTIVRIADWFGINKIICSNDCVELYNPKCIQSAMGSVYRVNVFYTELSRFLENYRDQESNFIYGAVLKGDDIYKAKLHSKGVIVVGNESHGISEKVIPLISNRITIPAFNSEAESLNVAVATGIILSEFKRRMDVAL